MIELAIKGGQAAAAGLRLPRWPRVEAADREAVLAVLDRQVFSNTGTVEVPALEEEYRAYTGAGYCLATNAGTAALHCCAAAVGLAPGDEVIVPAFTYAASAMFVAQQGAAPVFADVDPLTYNLSPEAIERAITPRTRAVVVVHLHGLPADMDEILALAARHDLAVIEDTAQAHGSRYRGRIVGTIGDCAGTSLNQAKNLPGGEGGFFLTDDESKYRAARRLRYLGEDLEIEQDPPEGRRYWCHGLGFNYRAQELPAAFARSQLRRLDDNNARAQASAARLSERLHAIAGIDPPFVPDDRTSVFHIYRARLHDPVVERFPSPVAARDSIIRALHAEGVACGIWQHYPLPAHPAFRREAVTPWSPRQGGGLLPFRTELYPAATELCERSLVLGSGLHPMAVFDERAIDVYADAIEKVLGGVDELARLDLEPFATNFDPPLDTPAAVA